MGLYSFFAEPQIAGHRFVRYLLYIGEAHGQSLRKRVTSYLYESQKQKPRVHVSEMLARFPNHLWLYFAVVDDVSTITSIEDQLLEAFLPPFNVDFPATVRRLVKAVFP
jgi:excinuclease UvrABC nuclease subunit